MQHPDPAAAADREHPAGRAGRLQLTDSTVSTRHRTSSTSTSKTCMSGTSKIASARAHQRAPESHVRWSIVGVFLDQDAWSLPILKAPTPSPTDQHAHLGAPVAMLRSEEPV